MLPTCHLGKRVAASSRRPKGPSAAAVGQPPQLLGAKACAVRRATRACASRQSCPLNPRRWRNLASCRCLLALQGDAGRGPSLQGCGGIGSGVAGGNKP